MTEPKEPAPKDWHRFFGLTWIDICAHGPFVVELEKDLSVQKQLLDVVIVRRGRGGAPRPLPDRFADLATHNLITFKSFHEALDDWALKELTGHYVNYRKLVSPSWHDLLPEEEFQLFAVCSRFPHHLANTVDLHSIQQGVYQYLRGTDVIRIIVVGQLPQTENNAMLHLFSGSKELVSYGKEHYRPRSPETSHLLPQILLGYEEEGMTMSYTMEDFKRDTQKKVLSYTTPQELIETLPASKRREVLKALLAAEHQQELIETLPAKKRRELLKGLLLEEDLSAEEIQECLKQREKGKAARKGAKRK